jgi:hypothetical protein
MFGISPKEIILKQLNQRFKDAGMVQVMFTYDAKTYTTSAKGLTTEGKEEPLPVENRENGMIKNLLVKNIKKQLDFDFTHLIANINTQKQSIKLYAKNLEGKLVPIQL